MGRVIAAFLLTAGALVAGAQELAADTPSVTPAGATFTAPAGWRIATSGNMLLLHPPEPDSRVVIVEVDADDADGAVAAGWAAYRPDFKRPLKQALPIAPRDGWEQQQFYEYETSPNERLAVFATAARAGGAWTVVIVDASEPTLDKRWAPISLVRRSLRPKGYQRETFAERKAQAIDARRIAQMKAFVASGMEQLGIPGVAFSLIDRDKVVFLGGLGVREIGKPALVDADTLFLAASNTKAMTTLLLARLVDEKKIRWDQPVVQAYPAFKLGDAETTQRVLIKHLVCACTGMPRQDMEWLFRYRQNTPASSMTQLATMQPTSRFGEVFQYSDMMAAAAGYVGAALVAPGKELGAAYDGAMQTKIFRPLGMTRTTLDFAHAQKGNHARPHGDDIDGKPTVARMDLNHRIVPVRPAGGVWTSAHDLSKYVQMELARGKLPDGRPLVSEENVLARVMPQVVLSADVSYGMGLIVDRQWGIPVVRHGGSLAGYHSDMIWLPEHGIGAVILTNSDPGWRLRGPFLRRLVELVFDGKLEAEEQLRVVSLQRRIERTKMRERLAIPPHPPAVEQLARRYQNAALGEVVLRRQGVGVVLDAGAWHSKMATRKNEDGTTSLVTIDPTIEDIVFVTGMRDGKRTLVLRDAQHEYEFVEADAQLAPK
jgi:CubicO group peptidase (beta-lactamase class C family)